MKRFICCIWLVAAMTMMMNAAPVSEDSARSIASRVLSFNRAPKGKKLIRGKATSVKPVVLPQLVGADGQIPYYVFTRDNGKGFAVIAADDAVAPLIGYSLNATFSADSLPCALKFILSQGLITKSNGPKGVSPDNLGPTEPGNVVVAPHLTTQWNQGAPYNWFTPTYTSDGRTEHYVTGCVPTAAAQVMNYYSWPAASYYRSYDWERMRDNYSYKVPYTRQEGMAVATLMRDLGVMMGSSYSTSGTSTRVPTGYLQIPGYKSTQIKTLEGVKEYVAKGPLLISISNGLSHAVIVDGLDDNDFYHVNWGWGGQCDGYYNLKDMGIMYGDREVHPSINELYSIFLEPDEGAAPVSLAAAGGVTVDCAQAVAGQEVTVTLHGLKQVSGTPFNGYLGLHITNGKNSYDDYYTATTGKNGKTGFAPTGSFPACRVVWDAGHEGEDVSITFTMEAMSSDGTWYIVPISCDSSEGTGEEKIDYHQLALYTDEFIDNNVTFNWSNNVATFSEPSREDYDL
ncbi:MAG: C10 family peptidase, partial [Muribaculaceae bacterium]|nr:C10 family peptidase [Muribaculaceae bacterium]